MFVSEMSEACSILSNRPKITCFVELAGKQEPELDCIISFIGRSQLLLCSLPPLQVCTLSQTEVLRQTVFNVPFLHNCANKTIIQWLPCEAVQEMICKNR